MKTTNTRHKHADVIIAYAEGKQIQVKNGAGNFEDILNPSFYPHLEYRIKPAETVVRWLWANSDALVTHKLYSDEEMKASKSINNIFTIKLEWSRQEFPQEGE